MFERYSRSGLALMFAPLYAGPVAAGWSAAPPLTLAVLAAVFFLIQLRLGKAPAQDFAPQIAALVILAVVQVVVVSVAYGVGMGLAWVTGPVPLPLWFPLALTGCSAVIAALRYRHAQDDAAMLDLIDRAVDTLETGAPFDNDPQPDAQARDDAVTEALYALYDLPDTATVSDIDPIVQQLETRAGPHAYAGLLAETNEGFRNVDFAMVRYLASPMIRDALIQHEHVGFALDMVLHSEDPAVLYETASTIETLLAENVKPSNLPRPQSLIRKGDQFPVLVPLIARVQKEHDQWQLGDR